MICVTQTGNGFGNCITGKVYVHFALPGIDTAVRVIFNDLNR
jgi:hypothetical protein